MRFRFSTKRATCCAPTTWGLMPGRKLLFVWDGKNTAGATVADGATPSRSAQPKAASLPMSLPPAVGDRHAVSRSGGGQSSISAIWAISPSMTFKKFTGGRTWHSSRFERTEHGVEGHRLHQQQHREREHGKLQGRRSPFCRCFTPIPGRQRSQPDRNRGDAGGDPATIYPGQYHHHQQSARYLDQRSGFLPDGIAMGR